MMKILTRTLGILFLTAALAVAAPAGAAGFHDDQDAPQWQQHMKQVREKIGALRAERMKKALELDEKTAGDIRAISDRYDQRRIALREQVRADMKELRQSLNSKNEGRIKTALEKIEQRHQAFHAVQAEERAEIKQLLTTEQQAKFVLFQAAFAKELREKVRTIHERRENRSVR